MQVRNRSTIAGQPGCVVDVVLDVDLPVIGRSVRRISDGATWLVEGMDSFRHPPARGDVIGLLLSEGATPDVGDELEWVPLQR